MSFLILLNLIALAAWLVALGRWGRMVYWIATLWVVGTVFGPPFFAIDGPMQISLDRMVLVGMIAVALFRWRIGTVTAPPPIRIDGCVLLLAVFLFFSSRGGDLIETRVDPTARWMFYILVPAAVYFVTRLTHVSKADVRVLMTVAIGLALYLSVTAVCEVRGWSSAVFPKHILDPEVWMFLGRGRGPLLNPAGNGFVIGVGLAAVAAVFPGASRRQKAALAVATSLLLVGGYATLTRSCWLGVALAVAVPALMFSPRWVRVLGLSAALLLVAALASGLKDDLLAMKRDKALSAEDAAKSVELRPLLATVAWEMFWDKPLAGHGYGQYFQRHDAYHTIRRHGLPLEQVREYSHHNVFLAFLVDGGLIGGGLFVAMLLILAMTAWRLTNDRSRDLDARRVGLFAIGVLACYLPNAMFHNMTIIPMVQVFLFSTAALVVGVHQRGLETVAAPARPAIAPSPATVS